MLPERLNKLFRQHFVLAIMLLDNLKIIRYQGDTIVHQSMAWCTKCYRNNLE